MDPGIGPRMGPRIGKVREIPHISHPSNWLSTGRRGGSLEKIDWVASLQTTRFCRRSLTPLALAKDSFGGADKRLPFFSPPTGEYKSCRSRKMLQNEYLVAIVAFDTAENEPSKV